MNIRNIRLRTGKQIFTFCILSSMVFLLVLIWRPNTIEERLETLTLDYRFHVRNVLAKPVPSDQVVVVAIDERSLKTYGRWPWTRTLTARLISKILSNEPGVFAVDIFFSESETPSADRELGRILYQARDKVVLATAFDVWVDRKTQNRQALPDALIDSAFLRIQKFHELNAVEADNVLVNVPDIAQNLPIGHVYSHPDHDGKLRWEILYLTYEDEYFPSLALQTARKTLGVSLDKMVIVGSRGIRLGEKLFIPTDQKGRMLINYLGREGTFSPVSAADVLDGKIPKETLRGRTVLLGTSAIATYDLKNTPFSSNMPGVEKNATIVENILSENFIQKSTGYIEVAALVLTGILMGIFLPRLSALNGALLCAGLFTLYILAVLILFVYANLWVNFVYPAANIMIVSVVVTVVKYFFEEKKSKEIRAMFSSYVSPKIVTELINDPAKARLGGDRKTVTILFADIMGFTTLSERRPPEEVVDLLNEYFHEMTDIIFRWDGTLDKFVGDEIMAFWGAPADQPNHAELAVRCALNMADSLVRMQQKWKEKGQEILDCGIGINTGEVVIGNIGASGKKMDYTVIGDHVNLAARVETLTRNYSARIILTEFTKQQIDDLIKKGLLGHAQLRDLEAVKVKGKEKEVMIFELKNLEHGEAYPE